MAPFRLGHDELRHELPWRLMQNGPITKYWRQTFFDEDISELLTLGYEVSRYNCADWTSESDLHDALRNGLQLPGYTGQNYNALSDSLTEIAVPDATGLFVAVENFTENYRGDVLLKVLADASRWWLLFGRIFGALIRTDDPRYEGPVLGAMRPEWNNREWPDSKRSA